MLLPKQSQGLLVHHFDCLTLLCGSKWSLAEMCGQSEIAIHSNLPLVNTKGRSIIWTVVIFYTCDCHVNI